MPIAYSVKQLKSRILSPSNNVVIHNRFILYFILFISLADLLILSVEQDFVSITIFILVGILTTYFSKNMLIILFIALTITNIIKYGIKIRSEGFEPADENDVRERKDNKSEEVLLDTDDDTNTDKKSEKNVKSDKYKDNKITLKKHNDDKMVDEASALFSKLSKIATAINKTYND